MAAESAGPVEILVDIAGNFRDELSELQAELEKIDNTSLNIELDIDVEEELKKVRAQLKTLEKRLDTNLDIDTRGFEKAMAEKMALSSDTSSTHKFRREGQFPGIPPPMGEDVMDSLRRTSRTSIRDAIPEGYVPGSDALKSQPDIIDTEDLSPEADFMKRIQSGIKRSRMAEGKGASFWLPSGVGDFFGKGKGISGAPQIPRFEGGIGLDPADALAGPRQLAARGFNMEDFGEDSRRRLVKLARAADKLRPNIMMLWNALAAMIPIMVSIGASAIGLAGAFIALGAGAAAIVGAGLLGWGDSFQSSLKNLQKEAKALGSELFDIMQPVAREAQPIMEQWMEGAPRQVQRLVTPLRNLIGEYERFVGRAGAGLVGWIGDVIRSMTSLRPVIEQIAMRFGSIAGGFLIDWMENMVMFAYENQDALIRMAGAVRSVLSAVLQLSMFLVRVLVILQPLTNAIEFIAGLMNNRWLAAATAMITTFLVLVAAIASVTSHLATAGIGILALIKGAIVPYIGMVSSAIAATWEWIASLGVLRGALVTTGIGAVVVGAGMLAAGAMDGSANQPPSQRPGGSPRGRGGSTTRITINGDVKRDEMNRLLDRMPAETRKETSIQEDMDGR